MGKRTTIRDIAREAGVTPPVVSVVLSGRASTISVSDKTRRRIERIVRKHNYKPDILARSFVGRKSFLIGVLVGRWFRLYALDALRGAAEVAPQEDYSLVTYPCWEGVRQEARMLELALERKVDGIIVNPAFDVEHGGRSNAKQFAMLRKAGMPVVEVFSRVLNPIPSVSTDLTAAGRLLTEHLIELGHQAIVHFTHGRYRKHETLPGAHEDAYDLWQGYRAAMREAGLEPSVVTAPLTGAGLAFFESARQTAPRLLAAKIRPSGVVCYGDYHALGLLDACRTHGVRIPEDLSITGFNDLEAARMSAPPLTTAQHDAIAFGRKSVRMLFDLMAGRPVESVLLAPHRVVRGSTAAPANA